jgi:hypothetical protein
MKPSDPLGLASRVSGGAARPAWDETTPRLLLLGGKGALPWGDEGNLQDFGGPRQII